LTNRLPSSSNRHRLPTRRLKWVNATRMVGPGAAG